MFGWLSSGVIDSSRSYYSAGGAYRQIFHSKYIALNYITLRPFKTLYFSLGSSAIIADAENLNIGYFIPIMYYTALDQSFNSQVNNAGQNSQFFFDISWDAFKMAWVYGSLFIDELRAATAFDPDEQRNIISWKLGAQSKTFTSLNFKAGIEYTQVRPGTYTHYIETTNYEHAGYTMGYFSGENSDVLSLSIQAKPIPKMRVIVNLEKYRKGSVLTHSSSAKSMTGLALLSEYDQVNNFEIRIGYQLLNDVNFLIGYQSLTPSSSAIALNNYWPYIGDINAQSSHLSLINTLLTIGF